MPERQQGKVEPLLLISGLFVLAFAAYMAWMVARVAGVIA